MPPQERKADSPLFSPAWTPRDLILVGMLLVLTTIVLGKDISVGGLRWGDTSVHAMDGVLIHDWLAAGPNAWRHPVEFAERQYGHYPCLGIGRHYPPGFAVVEAAFFAVFGISAFTARLCVVCFGLAAAVGAYAFMRTVSDRTTSAFAAAALMTMPSVTLWGRQAMLEVPTLAVLCWAAFTFSWYLQHPSGRRYILLLVVATTAILFRQTGVFLHSAIAATLLFTSWRRLTPRSHCACSMVIAVAAIALVAVSFEGAGERMMRGRASYPGLWEFEALTFYLRQLPGELGWPLVVAAIAGVIVWPRKRQIQWVLMVSWFFVCYVMVSAADLKWTRFFFVGLFPPAMCAGVAAGRALALLPGPRIRGVVAAPAVAALGAAALCQPIEHHPDYGAVVVAHREKIQDKVVLFSGLRDTHFVFAVRQHIPWRRSVVIRGSKLFYVCNTVPTVDFEAFADTANEIGEILRPFAFESVFTERENKHWIPQEALVQEYLAQGGEYRRTASHLLRAERDPTWRDTTIDVHEPTTPIVRTVDYFDIPIPRSNRTVRVNLAPTLESPG